MDQRSQRKAERLNDDMIWRREVLEADVWTRDVTPETVVCYGWDKKINLRKGYKYSLNRWSQHKKRCEAIKDRQAVGRLSKDAKDQSTSSPLEGPHKRSTRDSPDRAMREAPMTADMASNSRARARGGRHRSSSPGRAVSSYSQSNTSSSVGPSISAPPHRMHVNSLHSLRADTVTRPERHRFGYSTGPPARSSSVVAPSGGAHFARHIVKEELHALGYNLRPPMEVEESEGKSLFVFGVEAMLDEAHMYRFRRIEDEAIPSFHSPEVQVRGSSGRILTWR